MKRSKVPKTKKLLSKRKAISKTGRKPKRRVVTVTSHVPVAIAPAPASAPSPASVWLLDLALEWWRLERWAQGGGEERIVARHVARRIRRILDDHELAVLDLTGNAYEAGLALEVVDTIDDPQAAPGSELVAETIAPIILLKGTVVRHGQIVLARGVR